MALEVEPCDCRHSHPEGEAWHSVGFAVDENCMGWHVEPSAHRLHPDDWLRLLRAWSRQDYGKQKPAAPAVFRVVAAGLTECAAEDACRQSRLAVYEERARARRPVFHPEDAQEATAADLEAMGLKMERLEMEGAA